jgi:hypothetical protein
VGPLKDKEQEVVAEDGIGKLELLNTLFSSMFTREDGMRIPETEKGWIQGIREQITSRSGESGS